MKIAVLGDIHGNIETLRAAYRAALSYNVEKIYHLGDLGGYAPFVNEVVDFVIAHAIEGVQGNYDYNVANNSEHCGCKYEDPAAAALAEASFQWTKAHASQRSREFMKTCPKHSHSPQMPKRYFSSTRRLIRIIFTGMRRGRRNSSLRWQRKPTLI